MANENAPSDDNRNKALLLSDSTGKATVVPKATTNLGVPTEQVGLIAGENVPRNRLHTEPRYNYAQFTGPGTFPILSGPGVIHSVSILGGTLGSVGLFDHPTTASNPVLPTFTPTAALPCPPINLDESVVLGTTLVLGAATIVNVAYY